jgi:hypothetical protein
MLVLFKADILFILGIYGTYKFIKLWLICKVVKMVMVTLLKFFKSSTTISKWVLIVYI